MTNVEEKVFECEELILFKESYPVAYAEMTAVVEKRLPNGKKVVAILYAKIMGMVTFAYVLKGKSAKIEITKKGYMLAFVYNYTCPQFSELGDIYVDIDSQGQPYRVVD